MVVGILLTSLLLYSVECDWFSNCERLSSACTTSQSFNIPPALGCGQEGQDHGEWFSELAQPSLPSGTTLYKVFALNAPVELGGAKTQIADLILTISSTTSKWGDQHLFFRHQTVEDDISLQPDWGHYLDHWEMGVQ